jgi:hypothetical protein
MRPTLSAIVVAVVLLSAALLLMVPAQERAASNPAHVSTGLRSAVAPTYAIGLDFASEPVLPGYHDTLLWDILNDTNAAPQTGLTTITILGTYYNTGDTKILTFPGTPVNVTVAAIGSWAFVVPTNASATPGYSPVFTVWANSTTLDMSQDAGTFLEVGTLEITSASICPAIGCGNVITTGTPTVVTATAEVVFGFATAPAPGETAKFVFYSTGSSPVTVPGVPASVTTDGQGEAAVTFTPSNTVFNVPGPNHVDISVTDSVNTTLTVTYPAVDFNLYNPTGTTNFAFWLNAGEYYSGATVTAYWQWEGTNSTVGTWNVTNYIAYDPSFNVLASGLIGSTQPTGSFQFALPASYAGDFTVLAFAHNATSTTTCGFECSSLDATALATTALLVAIPSEYYFSPGDTITVTVTADGPALAGATIGGYVQASNSGQSLFNGTVTGGSFQFTIPKVAPADEYKIAVWASSPTAGTIATATNDVVEASGYSFWMAVSTVSSYSDGSFAAGQTVQVGYKVVAYGTSQLPTTFVDLAVCSYSCGDGPALHEYIVSSASGSVSFTIPAGTINGLALFYGEIEFYGSDHVVHFETTYFSVIVNSSPSALNYELGAGSGLTVGWLILLLLIIIVVVVLFAMRGRGRSGGRMVMSPTSSPEWKEPQTGGGASGGTTPPAPPPTGGST